MRIGIAGFLHESNTFASEKTTLDHFREAFLHYGSDLLRVWRDAHHELGGFIAGCEDCGLEIVPLLAASATPKGRLTDACYETIIDDLTERLRAAAPLAGLLLALHGAMVTESIDSADSETLRRVRECVGDDVPIILSLDMHANVSPAMVAIPNATIIYRTYPHVDQRDRGIECARLMSRVVHGEVKPVQARCKLPLLIHIVQQYTGAGPMCTIMDEVERIAALPGILSASVAPGYIYADVPDMGVTNVVVADGDLARAKTEAESLGRFVFDRRHELNAALPDVESAVRRAAAIDGTVCIMDSGDNIGAGSPGDSTVIFEEILKQRVPKACVVLFDPDAARLCEERGLGNEIQLDVGGKSASQSGKPIAVSGRIKKISDGQFIEEEARHGGSRDFNQGLTAVIETDDGHTVVVNSLRVMPTSLQQLISLGIEPERHKVIVVKGVTAPRAAYDPIAAEVIVADSPGVSQAGPESFEYFKRPSPLFPLEDDVVWVP